MRLIKDTKQEDRIVDRYPGLWVIPNQREMSILDLLRVYLFVAKSALCADFFSQSECCKGN